MKPTLVRSILSCLMLTWMVAGQAAAAETTLLDVTAGKGRHFFALSVSENADWYELIVTPGSTRVSDRVSSAALGLNGETILRPRDFNQNVERISRRLDADIVTAGANRVEVEIGASPPLCFASRSSPATPRWHPRSA